MSIKMASSTIKRAVVDVLEDLTSDDFLKFCDQLRDCREEPRFTRRAVDGKSVLEIANLLVSRFTVSKALQVTLDTLRQIKCNGAAETLYSNTKACLDKGDPTLPDTLVGKVEKKDSQEAPKNDRLVLSRFTIQFGKYKGQTFKWLLENDVQYAVYVVATHQMEREQTSRQDPMMSNKDSLTQYATADPEVLKEVKAYQRSHQPDQAGKALVGFGIYQKETLQDLYESKDPRKISYIDFLRGMESTCEPGSKMEVAIKYILKRDRQQASADRERPAKKKWFQSTGAYPKNIKKAKN